MPSKLRTMQLPQITILTKSDFEKCREELDIKGKELEDLEDWINMRMAEIIYDGGQITSFQPVTPQQWVYGRNPIMGFIHYIKMI